MKSRLLAWPPPGGSPLRTARHFGNCWDLELACPQVRIWEASNFCRELWSCVACAYTKTPQSGRAD
jgi:hypothetical protein